MTAWLRELGLGARLALAGGRGATVLTTIGVALGVSLLLGVASVPNALQHRDDRGAAREYRQFSDRLQSGEDTLLIASFDTTYRRQAIRGRVVRAEGPRAPLPPGVQTLPGPGEVVVSPALAAVLRRPGATLLRDRLDARVVGTIGDAGLIGPDELAFYLGSDALDTGAGGAGVTSRIDRFGLDGITRPPLDAVLLLLVVVLFVVLLVPLGVFIATAVRFGGEQRDRRLAALRLVGADRGMVRRIAAGETLVGALLGLLLGGLGFLLARPLVESINLWGISVYAADLEPGAGLAALIVLLVPATAVVITLASLRLVVIEPLGVVRRALGRPRRLLWRLVLPALGLLLLLPLLGSVDGDAGSLARYQVAAGAACLLVGVAALLPWLVEAIVRRLRGPGVAGQLAIRALQLRPESSARMVNGIAVAAAGAIALQMLFAGVRDTYRTDVAVDGADAQVIVPATTRASALGAAAVEARLAAVPGIRPMTTKQYSTVTASTSGASSWDLVVGSCSSLRTLITIDRCAEGDVFVLDGAVEEPGYPNPGQRVTIGDPAASDAAAAQWTVPATARLVAPGPSTGPGGVYATPSAVPAAFLRTSPIDAGVGLDPGVANVDDALRTAAARLEPLSSVFVFQETQEDRRFTSVRRGLYIGAAATLALIGVSMLVSLLEGLRQRRRLLAVLVAVGTKRTTLGWSVLWQAAVPVVLGLLLAVAVGVLLGSLLLAMVSRPVALDPTSIAVVCGTGLAVAAGVTALGLPALWRLMRPDGLRTE